MTQDMHPDHLGSPREMSNASGARTGYAHYSPFGMEINTVLPQDQGGFTGHIKDSTTGLSYMQARYYDPVLGRFLSVDPVTFMETGDPRYFNRYVYAANDPVNLIDPDGQFFGLAGKVIKLAVKGGDVGATVAGAVTDTKTIFSKNATIGQRLGATASLATEVFSPVSARDAKAGAKLAKSKLSGKCCFVAGTLVETEYGLRPIEEIELGDRVLARNPETGVTALKSVTDLIRLNKRQIWEVSLSGNDGTSEFFETTDDHPWWIVDEFGNGSWKDTAELSVGMTVTTADNQTMIITKVVETGRIDATYNLTVADFETYFVGENRILVHNCGRTGKQARLKEMGQDPKLGKADGGWIKQEQNSIARGQRKNIRVPPGKEMAHERGREAAKGYDYKHSNLQNKADHRTQHKYDNNGRNNKERPVE